MKQFCLLTCTVLVAIQDVAMAQAIVEHGTSKTVWLGESGKLEYSKDINGNRDRLTNQENLKNMGRYPWVKELLATVPAE